MANAYAFYVRAEKVDFWRRAVVHFHYVLNQNKF